NLVVSNNAPQTFAFGQTQVRWTVTDSRTGAHKDATQVVSVTLGTDPSCVPAGLTIIAPLVVTNGGFDIDTNGDGVPDGWNPGGTGGRQLVSNGFDGRSYKLVPDPSSSYGVSADAANPVVLSSPLVSGQKVLLALDAFTTGSLNLAEIEGNYYNS